MTSSNKFTLIFWILLSLVIFPCSNANSNGLIKYAEIYGQLSIVVGTFERIDKSCKTNFVANSIINELNILYKNKTGHSYHKFGSIYANLTETNERIEGAYQNMLSSIGGCNLEKLRPLFEFVLQDKINPAIADLKRNL